MSEMMTQVSSSSPAITATGKPVARSAGKPDRRVVILDAAERCFAKSGFHQTSMQAICAEAGMSPGNLYRYFRSKEAIIAGIAERDRARAAEAFTLVTQADVFFAGMMRLAEEHVVGRTADEIGLYIEILAERGRNPAIAAIYATVEADIKARIVAMLHRAADRQEISPDINKDAAASMLMVLADGLTLRKASDPGFDHRHIMPMVYQMVHGMLTAPPTSDRFTMPVPAQELAP